MENICIKENKKVISDEIWDQRGNKYEESITTWPLAMFNNVKLLLSKLELSKRDIILEFSAGSGFFTIEMAKTKLYAKITALDVSKKMLKCLQEKTQKEKLDNISILLEKNPSLPSVADESISKIITLGGFHHVFDQIIVMKSFYRVLKKGGKAVIADFRDNSKTQEHFDHTVRKYSSTGHDALFLSKSHLLNLASIAGFTNVNVYDVDIDWPLPSLKDLGKFFVLHHDLRNINEKEVIELVDKYLGIEEKADGYNVKINYCVAELYK